MSKGFWRSSFGLSFVSALVLCVALVGVITVVGARHSTAQLRLQGNAVLDRVAAELEHAQSPDKLALSKLLPSLVALPYVRRIAVLDSGGTTAVDYVGQSGPAGMPSHDSKTNGRSGRLVLTKSVALAPPHHGVELTNDNESAKSSQSPRVEIRVELFEQPMPEPIPAILSTSAGVLVPALLVWLVLARRYYRQRRKRLTELSIRFERLRGCSAAQPNRGSSAGPLTALERHADSVGDLLERMQTATSKHLERVTSNLQRQLEQLQRRNDELAVAHRKALEASHRKSAFLADMSHEIRTPMNGVLGYLEVLGQTNLDASQRSHLDTAQASAQRLMGQIDDILDFSKIEAGKLELYTQPYALREMLEESVALFAANARAKNISLFLDVEPNLPESVLGDGQRVSQIIANLVSNAVKYTEHGRVVVHAGLDHSSVKQTEMILTVTDTGPGIPADQQQRLFAAFNQLPPAQHRGGGTGLGLAICERLAELMGARIVLKSKPNEGSQFKLCLPLNSPPDARFADDSTPDPLTLHLHCDDPTLLRSLENQVSSCGYRSIYLAEAADWDRLVPDADGVLRVLIAVSSRSIGHQKLLHELEARASKQPVVLIVVSMSAKKPPVAPGPESRIQSRWLSSPVRRAELIAAMRPTSEPAAEPMPVDIGDDPTIQSPVTPRPGMRVLLADDNPINRRLAGLFLQQLGARVTQAENGFVAIETCRKTRFDLILMDVHMPLVDGPEAAAQIRACSSRQNADTPIVALTADITEEDRHRLLQQGLDAVATKPITQQALRQLLLTHQSRPDECDSVLLAQSA